MPSVWEREKQIWSLLPGTTVELTWQKLLLANLANGSINTYTCTHTHTHTHTYLSLYIYTFLSVAVQNFYSLKGCLTKYQQKLAKTRPNITTLCKRIKLSLSTFEWELGTLSATLIPLYKSINIYIYKSYFLSLA